MRISSALLTAAMIISGIVVIEANPASAQSYAGSTYAPANGYRPGYGDRARGDYGRPADAPVIYDDDAPGYHPVPRYGYADPRTARPVYAAPVYQEPVYQAPIYEAPRYAPPTYVRPLPVRGSYGAPIYAEPADPCRDR